MSVCFYYIKKFFLFITLGCLMSEFMTATSITSTAPGGDSTTGYQATAPGFSSGDMIRGNVMFKAGFIIPSGAGGVTWDGDGIVNGSIIFHSTTSNLILATDLRLGSTATLVWSAATSKINGQGNSLKLDSNITFSKQLSVASNLTIDGQGNTLFITNPSSASSAFSVSSGVTLTLKNMTIVVSGNSVSTYRLVQMSFGSGCNLILENVVIRCTSTATSIGIGGNGTITIRGNVSLENPGGLIALTKSISLLQLIIEKNSTLHVGKQTIFAMCTNGGSVSVPPIAMVDRTSTLHLDGCDFYTSLSASSNTAFSVLGGTLILENKVRIFNTYYSGPTGNSDMTLAFILGDGTAANDVNVRVLGGAYVMVDGCMQYNHS